MRRIVVVALSLFCAAAADGAIPASERQALLDLYVATQGSSWSDASGWNGTAGTECSWKGVECDPGGLHVTGLRLPANNLNGSLPASLSSLEALEALDLSYNALTGTLSPAVSSLGELVTLEVSGNHLSGSIPASLGELAHLEELGLGYNAFTGTVPATFSALTSLRRLDVSYNDLEGPLPDLAPLVLLESLDFGGNPIATELPPWIFTLHELRHLGFQESGMTGAFGPELLALTKLEQLYGWDNELEGTLGEWIGDLTSLRMLLVGGNRLTGPIPLSITKLTGLTTLDLQGNLHTGTIPHEIGSLVDLEYLSLGENALSGEIPASFSNLTKLIDVRLDHNDLTGDLPSFAGFDSLEVLLLHVNRFSGPFPVSLYEVPELYLVSLGSNQFSGELPSDLDRMGKLQILDLSQNAFVGEIPEAITALPIEPAGLNVSYNALYTSNATVRAFVDAHDATGGEWSSTQTVAPTAVATSDVTDRSVVVSWDPIEYIYDGGGYRITATLTPEGDPVAIAALPEKESVSGILRGLTPDTTYYIRVRAFTNPNGYQRNLVLSDPTAAVSITTTARVVAPADVAVTKTPFGIVQIGGISQNESEMVLTNFGDSPTTVTLARVDGTFFEIDPAVLTIAPGSSATAAIRVSAPQPSGGYWGTIGVTGAGVPTDTFVSIELLSVSTPTGTVIAEASSSRVDLSGAIDSTSVGTVTFRNVGNSELSGVIATDVPWISVPPALVRIQPGEEGIVTFTVDRSRRSGNERVGAVAGTLSLIYVGGESATSSALASHGALKELPPGVSASVVKVVDTTGGSTVGSIPPLPSGEVAHLIPGVRSIDAGDRKETSDVAVSNATGVQPIDDLRMYFQAFSPDSSRIAPLAALSPAAATMLANVANSIYDATAGSIQLRSSQWARLSSSAVLHISAPGGPLLAAHPVYRSDRAVQSGDHAMITGVQRSDGSATLIFQEASGSPVHLRIEELRADGSAARASRTIRMNGWSTMSLPDALTDQTATVLVGHEEDSEGSFLAVAEIDEPSGDVSLLPDWRSVHGFDPAASSRVVRVERATAQTPRRRGVRRGSIGENATTDSNATKWTELWLFNGGDTPAAGELTLVTDSGTERRAAITLAPRQTLHYDDVLPTLFHTSRGGGSIIWSGVRGIVHLQARVRNDAGQGGVVPVTNRDAGLRLGESRIFAGVEDVASPSTTPGGVSTSIVLQEIAQERARVRLTVRFASAQSLTSTLVARDIEIAPGATRDLGPAGAAILGESLDRYGDLRNVQIEVKVIEGAGAVQPVLRVETNDDVMFRID